jgi:hypothetical protein
MGRQTWGERVSCACLFIHHQFSFSLPSASQTDRRQQLRKANPEIDRHVGTLGSKPRSKSSGWKEVDGWMDEWK